jgi:hypothetical protein
MVTREALRILHQKCNFIGSINRQYDDSFAREGAKIGDSLKIRLPNQYTVRDGVTMSIQDTIENSVTLQVAKVKGVDLSFTSQELTLSLDDFSKRILEPAMAVLAANIEADALTMKNDVYNQANNTGNPMNLSTALQAGRKLTEELTPTGDRTAGAAASCDRTDLPAGVYAAGGQRTARGAARHREKCVEPGAGEAPGATLV